MATPFTIVMPVYDGVDHLDVAGAREMFFWAGKSDHFPKDVEIVQFTVSDAAEVTTQDNFSFRPNRRFDAPEAQTPQMIWVPGGAVDALNALLATPDAPLFEYILRVGQQAKIVASVCEGALLLAKTGLLDGYKATTHWLFYPCLETYPKVKVIQPRGTPDDLRYPHYIWDENRVTGGGISSGLDESLSVIETLWGTAVAEDTQRSTQYSPKPPVSAKIAAQSDCPVTMPDTPPTTPR